MKKSFLAITIFIILFSCQSTPHVSTLRPEQKLAILDHWDTADQRVKEMGQLLDTLSRKYKESKDTIVKYTVKAQDLLKDFKIYETNMEVLEGMNRLPLTDSTSYQGGLVVYVLGGRHKAPR